MLAGPPGTGKTLLAKALAGESGCKFYYKSGSEFDEVFAGLGAKRIRNLFKEARKNSPAIIFIDEIDALTSNRSSLDSSYSRASVNQLLSEMDGFSTSSNVVVIGATNLIKGVDKAVLRPGRFDKVINISPPGKEGREKILEYYLNKVKYDKETVDKSLIARSTTGLSGAHLKNLVNLAILNAIKEGRDLATHQDFEYAIDRIRMGIGRKTMYIEEKDKLMTAYHEGGHTLVSLLTPGAIPLHKVTILPRGGALGFTSMVPENDITSQTSKEILAFIDVALGGRVAEELIYGDKKITTGCSSDISRATEMAYAYIRHYGMDKDFSILSGGKDSFSEHYNSLVDERVNKLLSSSLERTRNLITKNRSKLDSLANELLKAETLDAKQVRELLNIERL